MPYNYWQNKKVIVTGSSGFLGSHFVEDLSKLEAKVVPASRDKIDLLDLDQTLSLTKSADVIINCAALDGNTEFKINHAAQILDQNARIVSNVLNAAKENNVAHTVLVSSSEIYSSLAPNPVKEEDDYRNYDGHTSNGYILSKKYGEILADLYQKEFGMKVYLPRPSNIYGPGDNFADTTNRVIPSFIKKVASGIPIEIWGDGTQIRQFIYVKDVVWSILKMVELEKNIRLNISTKEPISIYDLARLIYQQFNAKPNIHLDTTKAIGAQNRILDTSKLHSLFGFQPISLKDGLGDTIEWFKQIQK